MHFFVDFLTSLLASTDKPVAARKVLGNLCETHHIEYMMVAAYLLESYHHVQAAIVMWRTLVKQRPDVPLFSIELARTLTKQKTEASFTQAIELLVDMLEKQWPARFSQIEQVILMELNQAAHIAKSGRLLDAFIIDRLVSKVDIARSSLSTNVALELKASIAWFVGIQSNQMFGLISLHLQEYF